MNCGGLSLSSRTEHKTVAVPVIGREPLSRAWTANQQDKETRDDDFFFLIKFRIRCFHLPED